MEDSKREFIEFMVESDVLKFGEFTLKSGRKSPFFMNAGAYVTGEQLKRLGEYYAKAIHDNFGLDFDVVFGPAYKGIPLAVVTAIALHELYGKEVRYCCNRKEAKDHGADAGNLLGATLNDGDRVIIVTSTGPKGRPTATGAVLELASVEQAVVEIEFSKAPAVELDLAGLDFYDAVTRLEELDK